MAIINNQNRCNIEKYFFYFPGQDRNFALERYGTDSRCFDHTEQMWEERSCEQVSPLLFEKNKF